MDIEPTLSGPISNRGGMTWATNSLQEMNVEQLQDLNKRHDGNCLLYSSPSTEFTGWKPHSAGC